MQARPLCGPLLAATIGKLANIVGEIGPVKGIAEGVLKSVVSGDMIRVEGKNQTLTHARPTVRLIFATNAIPPFADRSEGLWRRLLVLPFPVKIARRKQNPKLAEHLCDEELPGILNWALTGLRRLHREGQFTVPVASRKALEEHRRESNPARQFLQETCVAAVTAECPCERLYDDYKEWCGTNGHRFLPAQHFGREVRRTFPKAKRQQLRRGGPRAYYYLGVRYRPSVFRL